MLGARTLREIVGTYQKEGDRTRGERLRRWMPCARFVPVPVIQSFSMRRGRRRRSGHPDGRLSDREAGIPHFDRRAVPDCRMVNEL